jgi:hypothetical protein
VRVAALLLLSAAALTVAGCGTSAMSSPAELKLQREDLIALSRALKTAAGSAGREVAATKLAWPLVANGLPAHIPPAAAARAPIAAAAESAAKIELPALLEEAQASSLTGPAAQLAGVFRDFTRLAGRGWKLISAALDQIEHGSPAGARFARENVALYIESVYDGHFDLAQIGKKLLDGYSKLGGPAAFRGALTEAEVDALARAYSEPADRLHPHVGVRLGS